MTQQTVKILALALSSLVGSAGALAQDIYTGGTEGDPTASGTLKVGPINLKVSVNLAEIENEKPMSWPDAQKLAESIRGLKKDLRPTIVPAENGQFRVKVTGDDPKILSKPGLTGLAEDSGLEHQYNFDVSLGTNQQFSTLVKDCLDVTIYRADGTSTTLTPEETLNDDASKIANHPVCKSAYADGRTWRLNYDDAPIALLEIAEEYTDPDGTCTSTFKKDDKGDQEFIAAFSQWHQLDLFHGTCRALYVLTRNEATKTRMIWGMDVEGSSDSPMLSIKDDLLKDSASLYSVNGDNKLFERGETSILAPDGTWNIDWQKKTYGCRAVSASDNAYATLVLKVPPAVQTQFINGIMVGAAKVFDVASLQRMLNATASQLSAISGFNANSINAAVGNFQGITRDTSYLSAQVTTTPLPTISSTNASSLGTSTSSSANQNQPGQTTTTVTLQCPDGSLPTIGSGNTQGCAAPSSTSPSVSGSTSTLTTNATANTPTTATTQSTGGTSGQQNSVTTTTQGVGGTVPTAPSFNPLTAPNNVGVASADILAEQVQLNSQITTLRLLLQGALSDQYLLKNSRAVGERQQTTLGFAVSLDPPPQFKHAVAEVQVIIVPTDRSDGPSIMNLLPAEKTYNVAKVTSNQKAFGAGAVIEPVSLGVNTGTSKDRLYLAKDTDTLALQFPLPLTSTHSERVKAPLPQKIHDIVKTAIEWQKFGGCAWDTAYKKTKDEKDETEQQKEEDEMEDDVLHAMVVGSQPIAFGWQFRPVLGEDYVQGGERELFAQLALGAGLGQSYVPDVYIATEWRQYNPNSQVVGNVYQGSCSLVEQAGGVAVLSQPGVRDVTVSDLGAGQLKLSATGDFFTSSISVLSTQNVLSSVFFDGKTIQVFGNAHDLLEGGDLKIVGQNGQNAPFAIATNSTFEPQMCGISDATLNAKPRPDGNSLVDLGLTMGQQYQAHGEDGEPHPLVLIGSQVYGLRESPFLNDPGNRCERASGDVQFTCSYEFLAPTTSLRNAQTFLVRDLAWDQMQFAGTTHLLPSFTAATALAPSAPMITIQPTSQEVTPGQTATFSVAASGTGPLTYQWAKNTAIAGATSPKYTTPPAASSDNGTQFTVTVSNSAGSIMSSPASLKVNAKTSAKPAPDPPLGKATTDDADGTKSTTTSYEISGYDFTKIQKSCDASKLSFDKPCLQVYYDSIALDPKSTPFKVVSDNLAIVDGVPTGAKSLRLQIYWKNAASDASNADPNTTPDPATPDPASTTEWDLTLPKTADENKSTGENNPNSIAGSPAILHVGDSQTVTFTSPTFASCPAGSLPVTFDGAPLPGNPGNCDPKKKNMVSVLISTAITKVPGHKELTVTMPGASQPTTLTFDVVKE